MPKQINIKPTRTYATLANLERAVAGEAEHLRYLVMRTEDGRLYPVFVGEAALQYGVHFRFCVTN